MTQADAKKKKKKAGVVQLYLPWGAYRELG